MSEKVEETNKSKNKKKFELLEHRKNQANFKANAIAFIEHDTNSIQYMVSGQ